MKPIPDKERCVEQVASEGMMPARYHRCLNHGTTVHEGKNYCKTHNPALKAEKDTARSKQRQQEYYEEGRRFKANQIKCQAERAVLDAVMAWRKDGACVPAGVGAPKYFVDLLKVIDRLIELG